MATVPLPGGQHVFGVITSASGEYFAGTGSNSVAGIFRFERGSWEELASIFWNVSVLAPWRETLIYGDYKGTVVMGLEECTLAELPIVPRALVPQKDAIIVLAKDRGSTTTPLSVAYLKVVREPTGCAP